MQTQQRLRLLAGSFLLLAVCAGSSQALSPVLRPIAPGSEPWSASRGFQSCAMLMALALPGLAALWAASPKPESEVPGLWAWGCKVLASLWVIGGMFDLLRSLLWMREGPTSGILGGYSIMAFSVQRMPSFTL